MIIFVSHPYGRDRLSDASVEINVINSILVSREIIKKGHIPFNPLLYHYVSKGWDESPGEQEWRDIVANFIPFCDALLYWDRSPGCDDELTYALKMGKIVFHSLAEIPETTK